MFRRMTLEIKIFLDQDYQKLKEMGFEALRLDYGFDDYRVVQKKKDFYLMLNASVVTKDYFRRGKKSKCRF